VGGGEPQIAQHWPHSVDFKALMAMQGKTVAHALGISAAFQDAGPQ